MIKNVETFRAWEFQWRMFISLGMVLAVCIAIALFSPASASVSVILGRGTGIGATEARAAGFLVSAGVMVMASVIRMWGGSSLASWRVMAFRIQTDALRRTGAYEIVRNPIYLADLLAMTGFALSLPPLGLLIPALLYLHYVQLVSYEENSLEERFGQEYRDYRSQVNRLIPGLRGMLATGRALRSFSLTSDGIRSNGLYALFAPGFVVAAWTGEFFHAVLIGLPALLDWGILHTVKGLRSAPDEDTIVRPRGSKPATPKVFRDILYAQCWEDPQSDRWGLAIRPGDTVFSICSGGCNSLALLLDNPRRLYALDVNPTQVYLLELKMSAFRNLEYEEMLRFLGVNRCDDRIELFTKLRDDLSPEARAYWENQGDKIREGIIHAGRYERYMALIRRWVNRIQGASTVRRIFETKGNLERKRLYLNEWNTMAWRLLTRVLLSRRVMSLLFDPAFFKYLETNFSFGDHFAGKVRHALTTLPTDNPYLAYILLGRYPSERTLPLYLRRSSYEAIRSRLDRVVPVVGSCEEFFRSLKPESISRFNFSNIFEWMSTDEFVALLGEALRVARPGARMVYRNLLVPRDCPPILESTISSDRELAERILVDDLSFIYSNFVVEIIHKGEAQWELPSRPLRTDAIGESSWSSPSGSTVVTRIGSRHSAAR